jgi:hypothetical protein
MRPLQVRVERVVEEGCTLEDVGVILARIGESLADRPETRRLPRDVNLGGKVGSMNDFRQTLESGVSWRPLVDECLEGASIPFVAMRVRRSRRIEADRPEIGLPCRSAAASPFSSDTFAA